MIKKYFKMVLCAFVVGIILASAPAAFAGLAYSNPIYYGPIDGYSYYNEALVYTGSGLAYAETLESNQGSGNVPTGYMGCLARLYNSSGTLVTNTPWEYNSQPMLSFAAYTNDIYTSGTYYSSGIASAYNGNGYTPYYTYQSPNQTL
ncbi:MAG: hypothetical protein ABSA18_07835 [Dehalococcoidia bacterium]|jgi:hypothetical protein